MPKLIELLETATVQRLYPAAEEALIKTAILREGGQEKNLYGLPGVTLGGVTEGFEITEPILRWVHAIIWRRARPSKRAPGEYSYKASGVPSLKTVLLSAFKGVMSDSQAAFAAQTIGVAGRNNRLFEAAGGSSSGAFWIREWPVGTALYVGLEARNRAYWTMNDEQKMQASLVRETAEPQPVVVVFNPAQVKIPDPFTPETAKKYILCLREGYEKAAAALEGEKRHAEELQEQLETALEELKELRSASLVEWQHVGNELRGKE